MPHARYGHSVAFGIADRRPGRCGRGFSLIELLVVVAVVALLMGLLLPSLTRARRLTRTAVCLSNLRQLGHAFHMYAADYDQRCMPLAYWSAEIIGAGPTVYWWGTNDAGGVDHRRGFVWPYLRSDLRRKGVFECPSQPWGSYRPQGAARSITSTYGYNGYYLSPPHTPGWAFQIGHRPWLATEQVMRPSRVFAFADTLIDLGGVQPHNNALLDPPFLFDGRRWRPNPSPTTCFRHLDRANACFVDGHGESKGLDGGCYTSERFRIGSVGRRNDPHYVPDWQQW